MMFSIALGFILWGSVQKQPWEEDLRQERKKAGVENRLVLMYLSKAGDNFLETLGTESYRKAWKPYNLFSTTGEPSRIELSDSEARVKSRLLAPFTAELMSRWLSLTDAVWRQRDALEFRAKGRPDAETAAKLAFSYVGGGELDKAHAEIGLVRTGQLIEDGDIAFLALAMGYEFAKSIDRAAEIYQALQKRTRDPEFQSMALIGLGRVWTLDHRDLAASAYRNVLKTKYAPKLLVDYADERLKELDRSLTNDRVKF